jgi:hypothetical protein
LCWYLIIKPTRCTKFSNLFWKWNVFYPDPAARKLSVWHIPLLSVQWITPDDVQRNCPKHVEFHFRIKIWEISASSWFYCKEICFCLLGYNTDKWSRWLIATYQTERYHHNLGDCSTIFHIELELVNVDVWDLQIKITCFEEIYREIGYSKWQTNMPTLFHLDALLRLTRERSTEFSIVVNKKCRSLWSLRLTPLEYAGYKLPKKDPYNFVKCVRGCI